MATHGVFGEDNAKFASNLYWCIREPVMMDGRGFLEWFHQGKDPGSVAADPGFADAGRRDFRLLPGSAARSVGFRPFEYRTAGLHGDPEWIAQAGVSAQKGSGSLSPE